MTQIFKLPDKYLKIMINVLKSIVKKTEICINKISARDGSSKGHTEML